MGLISSVRNFSKIAVSQPQAAYAAMTKSLQCEWIYLQHVIPDCGTLFAPLEHTILMHKPLLNIPAFCDGCSAPSTLDQF